MTRRTLTSLCICFSICSSECVVAVDAQRDARDVVPLGRADGEALDVVAAAREHARDPRQRTRLVLEQDGDGVHHAVTSVCVSCELDEVERGRAGGDHREAVLARVDARVDDARSGRTRSPRRARRRTSLSLSAVKPSAPYARARPA